MEIQEYIESGILELYVFGTLNESETKTISDLEKSNIDIKNEIIAIEKAILNLSSSFAPNVSVEVFERIKSKLLIKHAVKVIELNPKKSNPSSYLGWVASLALLLGAGYFYNQSNINTKSITLLEKEKSTLQNAVLDLNKKNKNTETALNIIRNSKNQVINLSGQAAAPLTFAKVYWNKDTKQVYVDASGLPDPPLDMEYQVWSLKMSPLTPTSIGLLTDFTTNKEKLFAVDRNENAEGFGITLEPKGGSKTPTMAQLYTLGTII